MKTVLLSILISVFCLDVHSQELFGQKNTVEITQKWFYYPEYPEKFGRKETQIFDKKGRLIKHKEFGHHHNRNLKMIGNIRTYTYQKNKLVSEKNYVDYGNFIKQSERFYWTYTYEDSRVKKVDSNHSLYSYEYDHKERLIKYNVHYPWSPAGDTYYSFRYNHQNQLIEKTQYYGPDRKKNWTNTYTRKGDTLITKEYNFNFPKEKDTTISVTKTVFKKNRLLYLHSIHYGETTKKYTYGNDGQLVTILTTSRGETSKTEQIYFKNGLLKQIRESKLENNSWIVDSRIEFEVTGDLSILSKKEIKKINNELTHSGDNTIQKWLN